MPGLALSSQQSQHHASSAPLHLNIYELHFEVWIHYMSNSVCQIAQRGYTSPVVHARSHLGAKSHHSAGCRHQIFILGLQRDIGAVLLQKASPNSPLCRVLGYCLGVQLNSSGNDTMLMGTCSTNYFTRHRPLRNYKSERLKCGSEILCYTSKQ